MGVTRTVVGAILSSIGILSWLKIIYENIPTTTNPEPISGIWNADVLLALVVSSIISGIGIVILVSSIRTSQSSTY